MTNKITGDWKRSMRSLKRAGNAFAAELDKELARQALEAEGKMIDRIDSQPAEWPELAESTLSKKEQENLSEEMLRATNTMFENITSRRIKPLTHGAGTNRREDEFDEIPLVMEYGTKDGRVKERPVARPVAEEMKKGTVTGSKDFLRKFRKKL